MRVVIIFSLVYFFHVYCIRYTKGRQLADTRTIEDDPPYVGINIITRTFLLVQCSFGPMPSSKLKFPPPLVAQITSSARHEASRPASKLGIATSAPSDLSDFMLSQQLKRRHKIVQQQW